MPSLSRMTQADIGGLSFQAGFESGNVSWQPVGLEGDGREVAQLQWRYCTSDQIEDEDPQKRSKVMPAIGGGDQAGNQLPSSPLTGTNVATAGVTGQSNSGPGVVGNSLSLVGAFERLPNGGVLQGNSTPASDGVLGTGMNGVHGQSSTAGGNGVRGEHSGSGSGVAGTSDSGAGVYGTSKTGNAGYFLGNHVVTGNAQVNGNHTVNGTINVGKDVVLTGADCAEEFDVESSAAIDAGTVMVVVEGGALQPSAKAYDRKVAGVISGAGEYRPGLILDRRSSSHGRLPIALVGKVYCKVDADNGAIEVGDLLTTSPTPGHAMKASDPSHAFGAVLGKALQSLKSGKGMIPILVALQ
jgi:hypothetical protein